MYHFVGMKKIKPLLSITISDDVISVYGIKTNVPLS
jgi:hypothetical protein